MSTPATAHVAIIIMGKFLSDTMSYYGVEYDWKWRCSCGHKNRISSHCMAVERRCERCGVLFSPAKTPYQVRTKEQEEEDIIC